MASSHALKQLLGMNKEYAENFSMRSSGGLGSSGRLSGLSDATGSSTPRRRMSEDGSGERGSTGMRQQQRPSGSSELEKSGSGGLKRPREAPNLSEELQRHRTAERRAADENEHYTFDDIKPPANVDSKQIIIDAAKKKAATEPTRPGISVVGSEAARRQQPPRSPLLRSDDIYIFQQQRNSHHNWTPDVAPWVSTARVQKSPDNDEEAEANITSQSRILSAPKLSFPQNAPQSIQQQQASGAQQEPRAVGAAQAKVSPPVPVNNMVGVVNLGNSCYASAVLSMLLRTPKFVHGLEKFVEQLGAVKQVLYETPAAATTTTSTEGPTRELSASPTFHSVCPVSKQLLKLFEEMRENSPTGLRARMADPTPLSKLFSPDFFDFEQHDAHEFYVALIARLEEEAVRARAYTKADRKLRKKLRHQLQGPEDTEETIENIDNDSDAPPVRKFSAEYCASREELVEGYLKEPAALLDTAWVNRLLRGAVQTVVHCHRDGCGCVQSRTEMFVNVSLAISSSSASENNTIRSSPMSVQGLLDNSLQDEVLEDYKCDKCGSTEEQHQIGSIAAAPPLLVFQLKRYNVVPPAHSGGAWRIEKNGTELFLNPELTVLVKRHRKERKVQYKLHALVLHRGATPLHGHYMAEFVHFFSTSEEVKTNQIGRPIYGDTNSAEIPNKKKAPEWYRANDAAIFSLGTVVERHRQCNVSYLLLYEKKQNEIPDEEEEISSECSSTDLCA